ncbi:TetR/AcrR family transcriptional regulator [Pseudobutyrivibrio sp. MD2005]|uniref:TetR/AcrR family transcriptional regulator n=1 Tax=Pseudobutyrivibrio sp. MD2005 TaxID=1410616 RepID=UPI000559BE9A|nr:TetR/AcrR family transcriptional regulator [Pseudobutyrivibrio sp. MD2005]
MNERILEGALKVFREKGPKFTMDDLASEMKMSKKTIYTIFDDKNELMCNMMDYAFDMIKSAEDEIYNNPNLTTLEKIRGVLAVLPESHYGFDYTAMNQLAAKYPMAYNKMIERLDSGWEKTIELIKKGMADGQIREINFDIFKLMYEACVDKLLMGDFLSKSGESYPTALAEVVDFMLDGIIVKDK